MPKTAKKVAKAVGPTRTDIIIKWLEDHQGWHSPKAIAEGTGYDTSRAASALLYLAKKNRVGRMRGRVSNGPGSSVYSALSEVSSTVKSKK
jgi:hypothetical protein